MESEDNVSVPVINIPEGHKIIIFKARTTLEKNGKLIRAVVMDFTKNKHEGRDLAQTFHEIVQIAFDQLHGVNDDQVHLDPNGIYRYIFHSELLP
uniref:Uncharacterized protein n=1 Tax=Panagrolaimus davidi TaxID=227884 RepID=A0A914RBX1_9BILA